MKAEEQGVEASYKVLVLGDRGVGKTSLLHSLTGKPFQDTMLPTVGADFIKQKFFVDGASIELIIWDSSGQGQLRSMNKQQYKDLNGLILVYDVTNEASLDMLKYWTCSLQHELIKSKGNYEPTPMIVCGNKCDLSANKKVSSIKGQKFSDEEMAFGFYEMSAKTGENVNAAFQTLAFHTTDICNPRLELIKSKGNYEPTPMIVCGNKCDLSANKKVSSIKDEEMAFGFYEMSAKTGENVNAAFQTLAFHITDICNPRLMKSYHPHCEKPLMPEGVVISQGTKLREFNGKGKKKAKDKKPDSSTERINKNQNNVEHMMYTHNASSYNNARSCPSLLTCCICFRKGKTVS